MDNVFIDASVFVAYANEDDVHHKNASKIIMQSMKNAVTSDHVFDEVVGVISRKVNREKAIEIGTYILQAEIIVARTNEQVFQKSWQLFQKESLSFTDCTIIEFMQAAGIKKIATFDKGFENKGLEIIK